MKHFSRWFAAALLLLGVVGTSTAPGQTVAPVPAATIINSVPYTISAPGFYQVGANLTYNGNGSTNDAIITINANNVTLDLGGHYLSGPSTNTATTLTGVYSDGHGNLTIQNGTVSHCLVGIALTDTSGSSGNATNINQKIRNLLVTHCYAGGIFLYGAGTSQVKDCQVSFIGGPTVSGAYGITIASLGAGCQIRNNAVTSIDGGSSVAYGVSAEVPQGDLNNSCVILGNTVDTVTGPSITAGIYSGGLVVGNKVSNCPYGVVVASKYQNNLTYNCTQPFYECTTDAGGNN